MRVLSSRGTLFISVLPVSKAQLIVPAIFPAQFPMDSPDSTLADRIPRENRIQIFSSLLRDVDSAWGQLSDPAKYCVVLAPTNPALHALPSKPWKEGPDVEAYGEQAYEGEAGITRANNNLKSFVERHVVLAKDWREGQKAKTISGLEVWWEQKDSSKVIQPGDIKVVATADEASNGEVWILDSVVGK
ncbi:FAS1 domain-containing protein [Microthyrium microscopicum]|uniref:FAS1 domain-containing protein n=1 Tax=Microthyrium microscopicum TaxID=703497 RepID=A0A6A6UPX5_9PEZI|nr:FAS1 domain-containing protein [Microthyrium microscopicum]